jgi:hypothetical protein
MRVILRSLFPRGTVRFFRTGFFYTLNVRVQLRLGAGAPVALQAA